MEELNIKPVYVGGHGPLLRRVTQATATKLAIFLVAAPALSMASAAYSSTFSEVKAAYQPSDTLILDRRGEVIHRIRTNSAVRRGQWVALADVSPALRTALVLSEDSAFMSTAVWTGKRYPARPGAICGTAKRGARPPSPCS